MSRPYEKRATWELNAMKKALSSLPFFNSDEENIRLKEVAEELKIRRKEVKR